MKVQNRILRASALTWMLLLACGVAGVYRVAAQTRRTSALRVTRPNGQYWIHNSPLFQPRSDRQNDAPRQARESSNQPDSIVIDGSRISIPNICPITPAEFLPGPNSTKVRAQWSSCVGIKGKVDLEVTVDTTGGTMIGKLTYKEAVQVRLIDIIATLGTEDSLRMGTYNVQFLPWITVAGQQVVFSKSLDDADHIADRIIASGYDVIVLQEVFRYDASERFVSKLKATYPHYLSWLYEDDHSAVPLLTSGLMIFSRLPFQDLPVTTHQAPASTCEGSDCTKVAYIPYRPSGACDGEDCYSDKGAALVRLRNLQTNHIYNIAFSHMQASYAMEDTLADAKAHLESRKAQFALVRQMIEETIPPGAFSGEDTLFLGDLNVDGDKNNMDLGYENVDKQNRYEWNQRFGPVDDFFGNTLTDVWAFETSPDDRGITNTKAWGLGDDSGARLDTILRSKQSRMCAQHTTLAHNLRWSPNGEYTPGGMGMAGTDELSDHIGVNIDLNMNAAQCKPTIAKLENPVPGVVTSSPGKITFPGSIQWFRFDVGGTYSFAVEDGDGQEFQIYESTDLSTPVGQYKDNDTTLPNAFGKPVTLKTFNLPNAPFFVKVFNPNRTKTGNYTLYSVRHNCTSQELSCILEAGQQLDQTLKDSPINSEDTAWFAFTTESTTANLGDQTLEVTVDEIVPLAANVFTLEVREGDGVTLISGDATAGLDLDGSGNYSLSTHANTSDAKKMYLLVKRMVNTPPPYPVSATTFRVGWTTNLNLFFGNQLGVANAHTMNLHAFEKSDSIFAGDDEIYMQISIDGQAPSPEVYVGQFSKDGHKSMEDLIGVLRFFNHVTIFLREEDGGAEGADEHFMFDIDELGLHVPGLVKGEQQTSDNGGTYKIFYNVAHGVDKGN